MSFGRSLFHRHDEYDQFSNLKRSGVFRLNIGVGKATFESLYGPKSANEADAKTHDFTALDTIMPHPVYGGIFWICVLNPGDKTFETKLRPMLTEAYELAVARYPKTAI